MRGERLECDRFKIRSLAQLALVPGEETDSSRKILGPIGFAMTSIMNHNGIIVRMTVELLGARFD